MGLISHLKRWFSFSCKVVSLPMLLAGFTCPFLKDRGDPLVIRIGGKVSGNILVMFWTGGGCVEGGALADRAYSPSGPDHHRGVGIEVFWFVIRSSLLDNGYAFVTPSITSATY